MTIEDFFLKDYEQLKSLKLLPYPQKNGKKYRQDIIKRLTALEIIKENLNIDEILLAVKGVCKASDYDLVKEVLL